MMSAGFAGLPACAKRVRMPPASIQSCRKLTSRRSLQTLRYGLLIIASSAKLGLQNLRTGFGQSRRVRCGVGLVKCLPEERIELFEMVLLAPVFVMHPREVHIR